MCIGLKHVLMCTEKNQQTYKASREILVVKPWILLITIPWTLSIDSQC